MKQLAVLYSLPPSVQKLVPRSPEEPVTWDGFEPLDTLQITSSETQPTLSKPLVAFKLPGILKPDTQILANSC